MAALDFPAGPTDGQIYTANGRSWVYSTTTTAWSGTSAPLLIPIYLSDANTVEQYNSTTAQTWRLYNTRTDAANYERLGVSWSSNVCLINAEFDAPGVQRNIALQTVGGNVGVGLAAPLGALHVAKSGVGVMSTLTLTNNNGATLGNGAGIAFGANSDGSNESGKIASVLTTASGSHAYLGFWTRWSDSLTEKMRLDHAGRLGIGVAPTHALHVYGSGTTATFYTDGDAYGQTTYLQSVGGSSGDGGQILFGSSQGVFAGIKGYVTNGTGPSGLIIFQARKTTGNVVDCGRLDGATGNWYFGAGTPTAVMHIKAGVATASLAPLKFTAGTNNTTAEAGAVEYDGSSLQYTDGSTSRGMIPRCLFTQTADKTIANSTVETTLFGTGVGTLTLPANFFVAGRTIRVRMHGVVTDAGSPSMRIRTSLGGTVIADTGAQNTLVTGVESYIIEATITCRTTGASGAFMGQVNLIGAGTDIGSNATATVAINTTASQVIDITFLWGSASASNTTTITNATVEVLN